MCGSVTKQFGRYLRTERINNGRLFEAVERAERGARLGRAVFLYGFAKSERDNIDDDDLARLKKLAAIFPRASVKQIEAWCEEGEMKEVNL